MRAAPAVDAALDGGRRERMLIAGLHALAGGNFCAWCLAHAEWPVSTATAALCAMVSLALGGLGWWQARRALPARAGRLRWDGQAWQLIGPTTDPTALPSPLQRLVVAIDLGGWMLLHLHPADGQPRQWRVARARSAGASWHALRVALAAHAGAPVNAPAPGPAP